MPTYQYQCKNCGHELEEFQSITEPPLIRCPACNTDSLLRVLGIGGGVIFKGSGFYLTDYKRKQPIKPSEKKEDKRKPGDKSGGSAGPPDTGKPKEK